MRFTKYSQETIEKLAIIASETSYQLPSERIAQLFKVVNLGMYDALREDAKSINPSEVELTLKANQLLSELYQKIKSDIEEFSNLPLKDSMPKITQNRLLDIDPRTYSENETLMIHDKDRVNINYIYLTQPMRKEFREKHKSVIQQMEGLLMTAKQQ